MNLPSEAERLLPCPFCGNQNPNMRYEWQVCCVGVFYEGDDIPKPSCACEGPWCDTEAEAITAWNTRALAKEDS